MARQSRLVLPGVPHHITQRGIRKEILFRDDEDVRLYHRVFRRSSRQHGLRVDGYCWMPNHIHVIGTPGGPHSIARTFLRANSIYARLFNEKYGLSGYVWEARPWSCPLEDSHFRSAIRYVERNPVRAGLVRRAEDYRWSSARAHCGIGVDDLLGTLHPLLAEINSWAGWLAESNTAEFDQHLRESTMRGRPCGLG